MAAARRRRVWESHGRRGCGVAAGRPRGRRAGHRPPRSTRAAPPPRRPAPRTRRPAWRWPRRRCAARSASSAAGLRSSSSTLPPGKTYAPPTKSEFRWRWSMHTSRAGRPSDPASRTSMMVAASARRHRLGAFAPVMARTRLRRTGRRRPLGPLSAGGGHRQGQHTGVHHGAQHDVGEAAGLGDEPAVVPGTPRSPRRPALGGDTAMLHHAVALGPHDGERYSLAAYGVRPPRSDGRGARTPPPGTWRRVGDEVGHGFAQQGGNDAGQWRDRRRDRRGDLRRGSGPIATTATRRRALTDRTGPRQSPDAVAQHKVAHRCG